MKPLSIRCSIGLLSFCAATLSSSAFNWPGGPMTVTVTARGSEVFAGWVPSSPWGSTAFTNNPIVELYDGAGTFRGSQSIPGAAVDWFDGGSRTATITFDVPGGEYSLRGVDGTRLVRIGGEGWSGFRLTFDPIADPAPANTAPGISWTSAPGSVADGQAYTVTAHGHDPDGNLVQVNVWKGGQPFAFGGGGNGFDADSGNASADPGPQTITFTAQAVDAAGEVSPTIMHTVTVQAPATPTMYSLATGAGSGGTVSTGGTFAAGSTVTVFATPDALHDFAGWSGDAGGMANPLGVTMDRDKAIQANFTPKAFTLTTSALSGGAVTPGGSYPVGTTVTITASADALHYFTGWTGDAGGTAPSIAVLIDRAKFVQAQFASKSAQSISFDNPGNQGVGAIFALVASASSGLPVNFAVVGGPAVLSGGTLSITGPGAITIQATQPGDPWTLPAVPVTATFNATAAAIVKFQPAARTLLQAGRTLEAVNYVLGTP